MCYLPLPASLDEFRNGLSRNMKEAIRKSRNFLAVYATAMAAQKQLRIFQLRINGKAVASRLGFVCNGQLYLYYSGYDAAWSKYSVMTPLVIHAMQWAIDQGHGCVNLSTGRDPSKLRWQPQEMIQHNAIRISPRARQLSIPDSRTFSQLPLHASSVAQEIMALDMAPENDALCAFQHLRLH